MRVSELSHRVKNLMIDTMISMFLGLILFLIIIFNFDVDQSRIVYAFVFLSARTFYYVITEYFLARSIGKILTKTKVVNKNGSRASLITVIIRSICRLIPLNPFSFLFGWDWHDKLSKTKVVYD